MAITRGKRVARGVGWGFVALGGLLVVIGFLVL